jgi:hypothetical protein
MKIVIAGFVALFVFHTVCGQTAPSTTNAPQSQSTSTSSKSYPNAKTQANLLTDAVLRGDYEKAADLTYPKLVKLIGGRAKYIEMVKRGMGEVMSDSVRIISTVAGDPLDVIEAGSEVYAVLPTTMRIRVAEGVLVGESYMIGVSNDRGEHWTFVDAGSGFTPEKLKILFPTVADRLKVPETKRPVLERAP